MTKRMVAITSLLWLIGGCASMNQQECLTGDWYTVGYEDGVKGKSADRIGSYRKACASHNVTPDLGQYQAGREAGLREFGSARETPVNETISGRNENARASVTRALTQACVYLV